MSIKPLAFISLCLYLFGLNSSWATQCTLLDAETIIQKSPIMFIGTVTAIDARDYGFRAPNSNGEHHNCGEKTVTFSVSTWLQGQPQNATEQIRVLIEDACFNTGTYVKENQLMFIAAELNTTDHPAELLALNICHGSGSAENNLSLTIQNLLQNK